MNEWMNHPLLKDMDPIMMALITSARKKNIQFTTEEINLILELLKEGKSAEEQAQIDRTIQMITTLIRKNQR